MDNNNIIESFECVRDHAWQTYISTMGESLPVEKVLNSIIERENRIYDLVYFFGRPKDTTLVIDELLQNMSVCHQNKMVIRMNARDITTILCNNVKHNTRMPVLNDAELNNCDLFVLEYIDTVAGFHATEELLYGVLDWFLENHVQIVITGNMRLADMEKLAPRIRAQIDGGISCLIR